MKMVLRLALLLGFGGLAVSPSAAQESWVGKTILVKKSGIRIVQIDDQGQQQQVAVLDQLSFKALADEKGMLQIKERHGLTGWFDKSDAVPLERGVAYFTEQIKQNPNDSNAYNYRASASYLKGDIDDAIKDYTEAIRLDPIGTFYCNRGNAYTLQKHFDKAIADYDEAIRLEPGSVYAYTSRGYAYYSKHEDDKALADFDEALRLDPKDVSLYRSRGNVWHVKKDYDKAIADYNLALQLDTKDVYTYLGLGAAWREKKEYVKAIADYSEAIRLDPKVARGYADRGLVWYRKKEYDKAIKDLTEAIRLDPKYVMSYVDRALAYSAKKEHDKAIADLTEAIRLEPKDVWNYLDRAREHSAKKQYAKALEDYNEAVRLGPKNDFACNALAWLLATCPDGKVRDGKRAVVLAKQAVDIAPKNSNHMDTLAAAYAEAGDFAAAVQWQERAMEDPLYRDNAGFRARLELYRNKKPYREE